MKRGVALAIICSVVTLLTVSVATCKEKVKTSTVDKGAKPGSTRQKAISLKILQRKLEACEAKNSCSKDLLQLAGITKIMGYVEDNANHDIILFGEVDKELPALYTEDFVVALRNAWLKYAELKGNTYYYSDPGCSIDPAAGVIKRLESIEQQILGNKSVEKIKRAIDDWHSICNSPQTVRVLGIPFHSRFGWVMVKADYDMKRLVDGADHITIPGFTSLTDRTLDKAKDDVINDRNISIPVSCMSRFWFHPGENLYEEDEGVVVIKKCPVILLTEEEHLARSGGIVGQGHADPLAQAFVQEFSEHYTAVAKKRPIYSELEALFRFVALAKIMKTKSAQTATGFDMEYFLERYPVSTTTVEKRLPGRSNVKEFSHRKDFSNGYSIRRLWLPSCGGVGIAISVSPNSFDRDTTGRLAEMHATVLKARPSPDALLWDFPLMWNVQIEKNYIMAKNIN